MEAERDLSEQDTKKMHGASSQTDALLLLSTCPDVEEARRIARTLVDEHLVSCVNISKVDSIYRWKDQVEESEEYLLIAKTRFSAYDKVEKKIRALHSYELPEIIALRIEKGYAPYLEWITGNVYASESGW